MRKSINRILVCAAVTGTIFMGSGIGVSAAPDKIHGAKPMIVWDYHKSNYNEDGSIRTKPSRTTFSTEGNEEVRPEGIPLLISEEAKMGQDIEIKFEDNGSSRQWVNNIYRITVLDDLTNNPNLQEDVIFKIENGKITLSPESRALTYNKVHRIKIYSTGYDAVETKIHIVKDAPIIKIHPDFRPVVNSQILFQLEKFNYAITNPIYEVRVDGKVLEGDCVQYHVVSGLIRVEDEDLITTPGLHSIKIRAYGFQDAELEFNVVEKSDVAAGTFDEEILKEFSIVPLNGDSGTQEGGNTQVSSPVDGISSASTGGSGGSGGDGGSGSMYIRSNMVFDFDMIANAYILRDLGMETEESERVRLLYELASKDAAAVDGINRKVDWSGFTNAYLKSQAKGEYLSFDEYINSSEAEEYINTPYYMKNVLEDGNLGEAFLANEALLTDAPEISVQEALKGSDIVLSVDDSEWSKNIISIKVGTTLLRNSEYDINGKEIWIKENRFAAGENRIEIKSYGYKTKTITLDVIKSKLTPALNGNPTVEGIFEVAGINPEYGKSILGISLNGENLYDRAGSGIDGDYSVYSDKIVFSRNLIKDQERKVLTIKAYGYEDVVITFEPGEKVNISPEENVVPEMTVSKGELGEDVVIRFSKDNPLWREKFQGVKNGIFTLDTSAYSIGSEGITIDGGEFRKGINKITIQAEGYDEKVMEIYFLQNHPSLTVEKASLENGVVINCSDWSYVNEITGVYVDGVKLSEDKYSDSVDKLIIDKSVFDSLDTYEIKIEAEDYKDGELNIGVNEKDPIVPEMKNGPEINTFDTFYVGEDMKIDFTMNGEEFSNWFSRVVVKVDGEIVHESMINESDKAVIINGSIFEEAKSYELSFESEGYKTVSKRFEVLAKELKQPYRISETYIYNTQSLQLGLGEWGENITEIKVQLEGEEAQILQKDVHYYEDTSNGRIIIKGDVFNNDGWADIWIESEGYVDLSHRFMIKPKMVPSSEIHIVGDSNINAGESIEIDIPFSFGEDSYEVKKVKINGVEIPGHMYRSLSSSLTLHGDNFKEEGMYEITLVAEKYEDKVLEINVSGSVDKDLIDSPKVNSDTEKNNLGKSITLTFEENEAWRNGINKILIDDEELWSLYIDKDPGKIELSSSAFDEAGTYTLIIQSEGYKDVQLTQVVKERVPEISTDLENKTVDREKFEFYSKWLEFGEYSYRATKVSVNGVEVTPVSGQSFSVTLNEGENVVSIEIEEYGISEEYRVNYVKPEIKMGPSVLNESIRLGDSIKIELGDDAEAWLNGIEEVQFNGETIGSSNYSIGNSSYFGRSIQFYNYELNSIGVYNVRIKSFPFEDVLFDINVEKKEAPRGIEPEENIIEVGDDLRIDVSGGDYSNPYNESIERVKIDGREISFEVEEGDSYGERIMTLDGSNFSDSKTYEIVIESDVYENVTIFVVVNEKTTTTTGSSITLDL